MRKTPTATGFVNKTMKVRGVERAYVVYVPRGYTPEKAWPLILFLHGAGERGSDGLLQTDVGLPRAIRRHADGFSSIVVIPQCPEDVWWDKAVEDVETALAETKKAYSIDASRVYLTGLSMGGFATWVYGAAHAGEFAALMPICGGGNVQDAEKLARIPIWAFHGTDDPVVPVQRSRDMVEAVKKAGGNIQYTEFPKIEHNSWDSAYDDPKTIAWLLDQHTARSDADLREAR